MTQNKFWLVCRHNEQNTPIIEGFFDNLQGAKELADFLSRTQKYQEYYICEATHHLKANVSVVETDLSAPENDFVELAEPTTEESLAVEPKFKVGDVVKAKGYCETYKIVDCKFDEFKIKSYDLRSIFFDDFTITGFTEDLLTLTEPTTTEAPKHEFKVGDIIYTQCVITKKQIKAKIIGFYNQKFCYIDVLEGDHKDNNIYPFAVNNLTLAE